MNYLLLLALEIDHSSIKANFDVSEAGSCISELQLKVNGRPKVNCTRIKFGLALPTTVGWPAQILPYNSLSASIHLYMIQPHCSLLEADFYDGGNKG